MTTMTVSVDNTITGYKLVMIKSGKFVLLDLKINESECSPPLHSSVIKDPDNALYHANHVDSVLRIEKDRRTTWGHEDATDVKYELGKPIQDSVRFFRTRERARFDRDVPDKFSGVWKTFYNNGSLGSQTEYLEGVRHGVYRVFDSNGSRLKETEYYRGKRNGPRRKWHQGSLCIKERSQWSEGKPVGNVCKYFDTEGEVPESERAYTDSGVLIMKKKYILDADVHLLMSREYYDDDGKPHARHETFWPNERIKESTRFEHGAVLEYVKKDNKGNYLESHIYCEGKLVSLIKTSEDGQIVVEKHWEDELLDGTYIDREDGKNVKTAYKKGKLHGNYWKKDADGVVTEGCYWEGEKDGEWKVYDSQGDIHKKGTYKMGKPVGTHETYFPNQGGTRYEQGYPNGKYTDLTDPFRAEYRRTEDGHYYLYEHYSMDKDGREHGNYYQYDKDGAEMVSGSYWQGLKHGEFTHCFTDGSRKLVANYYRGKKEGRWLYYYPDGRVESDLNYYNNQEHGPCTRMNGDGTVHSHCNYVHGYLHGQCFKCGREETWVCGRLKKTANI